MMRVILAPIIASLTILSFNQDLTPQCNGETVTYEGNIKAIIDAKCTESSCHNANSKRGDYTSYAGLKAVIANGKFKKRVLEKQNMPKNKTLSQDEINTIQCWVENNYAEK